MHQIHQVISRYLRHKQLSPALANEFCLLLALHFSAASRDENRRLGLLRGNSFHDLCGTWKDADQNPKIWYSMISIDDFIPKFPDFRRKYWLHSVHFGCITNGFKGFPTHRCISHGLGILWAQQLPNWKQLWSCRHHQSAKSTLLMHQMFGHLNRSQKISKERQICQICHLQKCQKVLQLWSSFGQSGPPQRWESALRGRTHPTFKSTGRSKLQHFYILIVRSSKTSKFKRI